MKTLVVIASLAMLVLFFGGGCSGPTGTSSGPTCEQVRAAYDRAQAVVDAADRTVAAESQALAALPPNDPTRKTLEPLLTRARAYATEVQIAAQLARVAVSELCPEIPKPPVVLPPAPPATPAPVPTQPGN